jgi:SAM-dependent methyltransferase
MNINSKESQDLWKRDKKEWWDLYYKEWNDKYLRNDSIEYNKLSSLRSSYLDFMLSSSESKKCVVDIGCGTNRQWKQLLERFEFIYCVDISKVALNIAMNKTVDNFGIVYKQADIVQDNLALESIGCICTGVEEYLDGEKLDVQLGKIVMKGGWLFKSHRRILQPFYFENGMKDTESEEIAGFKRIRTMWADQTIGFSLYFKD